MKQYITNMETQKLELHFDKADYLALSDEEKKEIRQNFLFSRTTNAWVSRAKFPNLYRAEAIAKKLGLPDGGIINELLPFAEQMERKANRAEKRAERYSYKAAKTAEKAAILQKPIHNMHGDISFFSQPNMNSSAGRAFTRRRSKMLAAWERGYNEFKKSDYYKERAQIALQSVKQTKPTDKGFIDRRIKDAEKVIRAQKKKLAKYEDYLEKIQHGTVIKQYSGTVLTVDMVHKYIKTAETLLEDAISKSIYYHECLENVGGISFSKDNIKIGYIVDTARYGKCKVIGTGKVNITYEIMEGGASGFTGKAAYAEIKSILSDTIQIELHPFNVGERYTIDAWNGTMYEKKQYTITKVTDEKVTLKSGTDRAITKKTRKFRDGSNGTCWAIRIADGLNGTIYKKEERKE